MIKNNSSSQEKLNKNKIILAKASGYSFKLYEKTWYLDKNTSINLSWIHHYLVEENLEGCLKTLAFYASNSSASHTLNTAARFQHLLRTMNVYEINETTLINYRATLTSTTEWYLGTIRVFLKKWYQLGYCGIREDIIKLLDNWTIKGNRKGDAVKRKDPTQGPLTNIELQSFNEGVIRAYEQNNVSLTTLAIALIMSNTGRRPIQISHLKISDILYGENSKKEPIYMLNIPKGKNGNGFRTEFKTFAITHELWIILTKQVTNAITLIEQHLGFKIQEEYRQYIPLFPDYKEAFKVHTFSDFQALIPSDKLHIASAEITTTLKKAAKLANIKSERTGKKLFITARRFRYTIGTRAAQEGFGELVIAELLDHKDTQNAGVYIKNIPEHIERLDQAVGFQLAPYAQAFIGVIVNNEHEAIRGNDPNSRIRTNMGNNIGTCGEYGFCGANIPIPCYTCTHFQPWINGPHEEVYLDLLSERERIKKITGDSNISAILDRSILAVADVILRCKQQAQGELKDV